MKGYSYSITRSGMGGFLNPPTHPEHTFSVIERNSRGAESGCMSLTAAVEASYLPDSIRQRAVGILKEWQAPAIESPEIQEWVLQVLGYFRGCYRNPAAGAEEWHAGKLIISQSRDPLEAPGDHAGVHLIRQYYPEFTPAAEHFAGAYWGSKPEAPHA